MSRAVIAVAALALAGLTGCGTMDNFARPETGGPRPLEVYGGVKRAFDVTKAQAQKDLVEAAFAPYFAVDIPFSAVADTLTLPITGSVTIWRIVDALNYMAEDHRRVSVFDSEWWRFWCNGQPTPVAQPAPPTQSP